MKAKTTFFFFSIFILASCLALSFISAVDLEVGSELISNESNITLSIDQALSCNNLEITESNISLNSCDCLNNNPLRNIFLNSPNNTNSSSQFCVLVCQPMEKIGYDITRILVSLACLAVVAGLFLWAYKTDNLNVGFIIFLFIIIILMFAFIPAIFNEMASRCI